jgi:hypothetical protein
MAKQSVFTSAPRGVFPGTSGYCTVLTTEGLSRAMVEFMEKMSAYRINDSLPDGTRMAPTKDNYEKLLAINPPNFAFVTFNYRGQDVKVLLKTFLAGFDSTGRLRKLSHFLVLDGVDFCPAGPAWLGIQNGIFIGDWAGEPTTLDKDKVLPSSSMQPLPPAAWEAATGDAGWAGKLAESAYLSDKLAVVIFDESCQPQNLLVEAVSLLPPEHRWKVTFATNFSDFPPNVVCNWRFVSAGSSLAASYANRQDIVLIDLTTQLGSAQGAAAQCARLANSIGPPQRMTVPAAVDITASDATVALSEKDVIDDQDVIDDVDDDDLPIRFMEDNLPAETAKNSENHASNAREQTLGNRSRTTRQPRSAPPVPQSLQSENEHVPTAKALPPPPRSVPTASKGARTAIIFLIMGVIGLASVFGSVVVVLAVIKTNKENQQKHADEVRLAAEMKERDRAAEKLKENRIAEDAKIAEAQRLAAIEWDRKKKLDEEQRNSELEKEKNLTEEERQAAMMDEQKKRDEEEHRAVENEKKKKQEEQRLAAENEEKKKREEEKRLAAENQEKKKRDEEARLAAEEEKKSNKPASNEEVKQAPEKNTKQEPLLNWVFEENGDRKEFRAGIDDMYSIDGVSVVRLRLEDGNKEEFVISKLDTKSRKQVKDWLDKQKENE